MAKYKMTGCARFFIFLIIFLPLAYFGAQYLMDTGKLDGLKDKIENVGSSNSVERAINNKSGSGDISKLEKDLEKITAAYREQQSIIEEQQATINRQIDEIERLKKQGGTTNTSSNTNNGSPATTTNTSPPTTTASTRTTGSQSLDELLKEADDVLGTSSSSTTPSSGNQRTIGTWRYSYSGVTGNVEFYEDRGKLFSKVTIDGDSRMDISELSRSGERFTVLGSRTSEYYILKQNGDLDAYDNNGYQTTCKLQ